MSNYDINNNAFLTDQMIQQHLAGEEQARNNPESILLEFKQELLDLGFSFQILNQAEKLLPKYKSIVLPVVIKYYKLAKISSEKQYLLKWFHHKGLEEVVPMLLEDYFSSNPNIDRWAVGDRLYQIRSKNYIKEYLTIVRDCSYGYSRQMIVLLLGKLKEESAIPTLIDLLEDEEVRLHAISALGEFKREEFRCYFERFQNSTHPGWRKYAKAALKKLNG